jgi:hypothetical protein
MSDHLSVLEVEQAPGIGRGTGCTLKEFGRALDAFMERKGMRSRQWKTLEDKREAVERARPCRIHKSDIWSLL